MTQFLKIAPVVVVMSLLLAACGNTWGQRAVTGGGIGAAGGALLGVATGGVSVVGGALIGGALGAGIGAATTPRR
jgi:predicted small secreted protein